MDINIDDVKKLKTLTGVGITDAKKALVEANGDFDKALEAMRIKGLAKADKKSAREAKAGVVHAYVHDGRIGVLVEVNCETDFVARTEDFTNFAHDIALHVAASAPSFIKREDISEDALDNEKRLIEEELKNQDKNPEMIQNIMKGKVEKFYQENCLMEQGFIKDPDTSIEQYTKEIIAKLGENIVIRQISRVELGGV